MAVDTRNKRGSCIAFSTSFGRVFPNPGSTKNVTYRRQIGYSYAGDVAAAFGEPMATHRTAHRNYTLECSDRSEVLRAKTLPIFKAKDRSQVFRPNRKKDF